ncbi:unnamed protein product [Taenia asiatica]|uniref:Heat shock 70 kDa protein 14 n=1 Tax=Taenia asiatica TaxID=60517 RepID=A0A0R3WFE5_TAEAS|nr:unnamed protein product [Taenia asiatica]
MLHLIHCTTIEVEEMFKDIDFSWDDGCSQVSVQLCEDDKADVQAIVLVGGSTRISKVEKMLQNFFKDTRLNRLMNPNRTVAHSIALLKFGDDAGFGVAVSDAALTGLGVLIWHDGDGGKV